MLKIGFIYLVAVATAYAVGEAEGWVRFLLAGASMGLLLLASYLFALHTHRDPGSRRPKRAAGGDSAWSDDRSSD